MSLNLIYTWDFARFNVRKGADGLTDVVYSIDWILSGHDGKGHGDQVAGSVNLPEPDPLTFTPFEQLTQSMVQEWVEFNLGDQLAEYKQILENKITEQITPKVDTLGKPW